MQRKDYKKFEIFKRNGQKRIIFSPKIKLKTFLRIEAFRLNKLVQEFCDQDIVHGFSLRKSPVTNAVKHIGYKFTLNMDIKDFFDSIKTVNIKDGYIHKFQFKQGSFVDGRCVQGFPTSPAISNLYCIDMDEEIKQLCKPLNIVYTRYADDLCFSGNSLEDIKHVREIIPTITKKYRLEINNKKTRIQSSKFGRRNITGVNVDDTNYYVPRNIKKRLRAAKHKKNKGQIKGLTEWSKLNLPKDDKVNTNLLVNKAFARHMGRKMKRLRDAWEYYGWDRRINNLPF